MPVTKSFVQTFAVLMLIALGSAVFFPQRAGGTLGATTQSLLLPVTMPMRVVAAWVHAEPEVEVSPEKTGAQWAAEVAELERQLASFQGQLQELSELKSERDRLGRRLRELCTPMKVIGTEASSNDLLISVPLGESIKVGDPVLYGGQLVGRIRVVGPGGARVRVLSDKATQLAVAFGRIDGPVGFARRALAEPPPGSETNYGYDVLHVEGNGSGFLTTTSTPLEALDGVFPVKVGDVVVLDDPREWPMELSQITVGTVVAVTPRNDAAGWADITIEPSANIKSIPEVQVMNK